MTQPKGKAGEGWEGWQDIASAPMDGTPVLLFARASNATAPIRIIGWFIPVRGWIECAFSPNMPVGLVPTHWMPLPAHPQPQESEMEMIERRRPYSRIGVIIHYVPDS